LSEGDIALDGKFSSLGEVLFRLVIIPRSRANVIRFLVSSFLSLGFGVSLAY